MWDDGSSQRPRTLNRSSTHTSVLYLFASSFVRHKQDQHVKSLIICFTVQACIQEFSQTESLHLGRAG